jgi:endoglucanase
VYFQNTYFNIKGFNWFGGDNNNRIPEGLWIRPMSDFLDQLRQYDFNAVRIPISMETVADFDSMVAYDTVSADPSLQGKTLRQIYHALFYMTHDRNMTVLLDFHTIHGMITEYPYLLPEVPPEMTQNTIITLAKEFGKYPNLIGIDIKNEPHGGIQWLEWEEYCVTTIRRIKKEVPSFRGMFFVEGVQATDDYPSPWGGSFQHLPASSPLLNDSRVVFSPHIYGVSVRGLIAMNEDKDTFDHWFGFLHSKCTNPIIIGEVGGLFIGDDRDWHLRLSKYLIENEITNNFYWCLNPDSGDTGGLLYDDWRSLNIEKIDYLATLQSSPTFIAFPPIPQ